MEENINFMSTVNVENYTSIIQTILLMSPDALQQLKNEICKTIHRLTKGNLSGIIPFEINKKEK
jgi:phosphopantetheine adenylyltransferase